MTEKIRSTFNRIILILAATGMIAGLIYSAAWDGSYNAVSESGGYQNEMSTPALPAMSDFIADSSAQVDFTRFVTGGDESGSRLLSGPDYTGRSDLNDCDIISVNLCIFLLCVLFGTSIFSFKHIFYIHLKDGNK